MQSKHIGPKPSLESSSSAGHTGTAKSKRTRRPKHEDIEMLAYLKYLAAGRENGSAMDHWLEAERQLSEE